MSDTDDEPEDDDVQLVGLPVADERHGLRSRLPIEILATQFADECREASRAPTIEDYARRYPKLAGEIREFFPMILAMERWKGEREDAYLRKQVPDEFSVEKLGEYRIVREIGRGGMGVVFEASQDNVSRRVAVKLLPWRIEHAPRWHRRFTQEARMLGQLRHPNIVPIYQFGEQDGYCYYVMQYIEGVGLDWIIRRLRESDGIVYAEEVKAAGRLSEEDTSRLDPGGKSLRRDSWRMFAKFGMHVARALGYAHRQDTLHNDIKPENLLLDSRAHVWVTDFGLAQPIDPENDQEDQRLTGTLRYMAPERLMGEGDQRSDVYSLGLTLYELVTLTPAFTSDNRRQLLEAKTTSELVPPRRRNKAVPRNLDAIIVQASAKDPADRYESADTLAADLLRFLNDEPVEAYRSLSTRFRDAYRNLKRDN